MAIKFGMGQDPEISNCALCGERVEHTDKLVVESETSKFFSICSSKSDHY